MECNLLTVQKIIGDKREKLKLAKKFKSISVIDMEAYYIKKKNFESKYSDVIFQSNIR